MAKNSFPKGWNDKRVKRVIAHYGAQTPDDAIAEDETVLKGKTTVMRVPAKLVPIVRRLIAKQKRQVG